MMKVASAANSHRFMLALKVVLADRGSAPTLVFDEIDSGAGGAVADAIGQRLARLAERAGAGRDPCAAGCGPRRRASPDRQGDAGEAGRVATRVSPLLDGARREEIARMLAGEVITPPRRAAADRLPHFMTDVAPDDGRPAAQQCRACVAARNRSRPRDAACRYHRRDVRPGRDAASAIEDESPGKGVKPWFVEVYFAEAPDEEAVRA